MRPLAELEKVTFPEHLFSQMIAHALRKLDGNYLDGEERAPKAYGLVAGRFVTFHAEVTNVVPLLRNQRDDAHIKPVLDRVMEELAIPSETPLDRRGWIRDPRETLAAEETFDRAGAILLGGYYMHRVAWDDDPARDSCTAVDTELAACYGLLMSILSMVDRKCPVLRAYFEGDNGREIPVGLGYNSCRRVWPGV